MVQHLVHRWHSVQDLPQKMRQGTPSKHTLHIPNTALWSWLHSGILDKIFQYPRDSQSSSSFDFCATKSGSLKRIWQQVTCQQQHFLAPGTFEFATLAQQFGWIWQVCTSRNTLLDDAVHAFEQTSLWVTLRKVKWLGCPIQKPATLHGNLVSYAIWSPT